jgi:hypothetical protein
MHIWLKKKKSDTRSGGNCEHPLWYLMIQKRIQAGPDFPIQEAFKG